MGGTWMHWHMPHIYREISLYGLHNDWIVTQNPGGKEDYCTATTGSEQRNFSHEEEVSTYMQYTFPKDFRVKIGQKLTCM